MAKMIEVVLGDLSEKKRYHAIQRRAKALPTEFRTAYHQIRKYLWATSGVETIDPFEALVDLFEEAAADGRHVLDVTGHDVAAFADDLVRGQQGYLAKRRDTLNQALAAHLPPDGRAA